MKFGKRKNVKEREVGKLMLFFVYILLWGCCRAEEEVMFYTLLTF